MTTGTAPADETAPAEAEVRAALERVLASASFRASPQLGAFLRFVVDEVLGGRGANLKGYTIAVEALGRDPRFNPQIDPIVRVEATRLRRALERHYAAEGGDDPVIIALPRGTYAPVFTRRVGDNPTAPALPGPMPPSPPSQRPPSLARPAVGAALRVLVFVAVIAAVIAGRTATQPDGALANGPAITGSTAPDGAPTSARPSNGMPVLEVETLRVVGQPGQGDIAPESLTETIKDAFARFDTINVASQSPPAEEGSGAVNAAPRSRADYRLSGAVEYGEHGAVLRFQLIDAREGTIAWSRRLTTERGDPPAAESRVAVALTDALLQSYGVIRARDHAKQLASPTGDPRYRCVLEAAESFRSYAAPDHERARGCLEHLTAAEPSFAVGFEFLAAIYYREYALGLGGRRDDRATLDLALRAAGRALELNPESGHAYQMLFVVLFARGDLDSAFAAGEKAMALNRYDTTAIAEYGGRLILTGETARGMAMMQRAGETGGLRPGWQHFYMFLGYYLDGDMKEAASQADQITADGYPLGLVARAITAKAAGDTNLAHDLIERLIDLAPGWRKDARGELARAIRAPAIVERLLQGLAEAGLSDAS